MIPCEHSIDLLRQVCSRCGSPVQDISQGVDTDVLDRLRNFHALVQYHGHSPELRESAIRVFNHYDNQEAADGQGQAPA